MEAICLHLTEGLYLPASLEVICLLLTEGPVCLHSGGPASSNSEGAWSASTAEGLSLPPSQEDFLCLHLRRTFIASISGGLWMPSTEDLNASKRTFIAFC